MNQISNKKIHIHILILFILCCLSGISIAATKPQPLVPAGSPMSESIHIQYAIYYLPKPDKDPLLVLKKQLQKKPGTFKLVEKLPKTPKALLLQAHLEKDVKQQYSPPSMDSLKYFGHGLSLEQAQALQQSQQALILNFSYPSKNVWEGLRAASELLEELLQQTGGLGWDELTGEMFTLDEWHAGRLGEWAQGIPDISTQTTIHAYKNGVFVRAISLGMAKFGLPDVVVDNFPWSLNRSMGHLINLFMQAMAEGAQFKKAGEFDLDIKAIRHPGVRDPQLNALSKDATAIAKLTLRQGIREEGDPYNRLIQIMFDHYPGRDVHAKQDAMLSSLFGAEDSISYVNHNVELLATSEKAKLKLPALRADFNAGLKPGEFILLKAPFPTPEGGTEWMWVEVNKWNGNSIEGLLKNEPFNIPDLHGGQIVNVKQEDVFDYIRRYPDGKEEGNETGVIIQKMQEQQR